MSNDKIKQIGEKSFSEAMQAKCLETCQANIPDPLMEDEISEIEKAIKDELSLEFKKGCFKVEFGNLSSMKPPNNFFYRYECECFEDDEKIELQITYDP